MEIFKIEIFMFWELLSKRFWLHIYLIVIVLLDTNH